jgi:hypothetical protein
MSMLLSTKNLLRMVVLATVLSLAGFTPTTFAAESSGGHTGGHGGSGAEGHGGGHDSGHEDGGHEEGSGHTGGPKRYGSYSGHGPNRDVARDVGRSVEDHIFNSGGPPVWAREGIPEVELGRLNVGRAPGFVLARAEDKALEEFNQNMAALYDLTAEQAATLLQTNYDESERIHSPVQNLALYKDLMIFGKTQLPGVNPASTYDLAAIFLGSASDKNIPITNDTIIAINRILGLIDMSENDITTLATKAEAVRTSILIGHDSATHTETQPH